MNTTQKRFSKDQLTKKIKQIQGETDQRSFAKALGVSQSTISRWLSGEREPSASDLARIAEYAGCSADQILFGETDSGCDLGSDSV